MRLYGEIQKVEPLNDGTVRVHGIASSEAIDDQGEIVRGSAMRAAIPDYMRFPALREMHQLSAAGTTLEVDVGDDNTTRIVAHVVDPIAVSKVKNQVYRGFSIGGRVTQREAGNPKTITALQLNEISLVDRPANPEAILDCWKASGMQATQPAAKAAEPFNSVFQIWACGNVEHRHIAKADAVRCLEKHAAGEPTADQTISVKIDANVDGLMTKVNEALAAVEALGKSRGIELSAEVIETTDGAIARIEKADNAPGDGSKPYGSVSYADPGHQSDGKKRYPIDNERHIRAAWSYINMPKNSKKYSAKDLASVKAKIVAAWKSKIDKDGPPSASEKAAEVEIDEDAEFEFAKVALAKSLWDIGMLAEMVGSLMNLKERCEIEAAMEGDDSGIPTQVASACSTICQLLRDMVAEETAEALEDTEISGPVTAMPAMRMAAVTEVLMSSIPDTTKAEALVEQVTKLGARHSKETQAQLDGANYLLHRGMGVSPNAADKAFGGMARKAVLDAGAVSWGPMDGREQTTSNPTSGAAGATQHSTTDTGRNAGTSVPNSTGAVPASPVPGEAQRGSQKASSDTPAYVVMADAMLKAGSGHVALYAAAHDLIHAASDGAACKGDAPRPGHMSTADLGALREAHGYLMNVGGVKCAASNPPPGGPADPAKPEGESEGQGMATTVGGEGTDRGEPGTDKAAVSEGLAKVEGDTLAKSIDARFEAVTQSLSDLATGLSAIGGLVKKIHDAPMPPAAQAQVPDNVTKLGANARGDLADEIARMSDDDITKALIVRARRAPMVMHGITDGPSPTPARPQK